MFFEKVIYLQLFEKNGATMSIPNYQVFMLPLLKLVAKHGCLNRSDAAQLVADELKLTDAECRELLPSGKHTVIRSRAGWARTYLKKAGLLHYPQRGFVEITDCGREVLTENPPMINMTYLRQFPEFMDFVGNTRAC